tara:strand:- start:303 stop:434 length:132 start_codon:yes stop_codon:yes gene_type:complete
MTKKEKSALRRKILDEEMRKNLIRRKIQKKDEENITQKKGKNK